MMEELHKKLMEFSFKEKKEVRIRACRGTYSIDSNIFLNF